MARLARVVAVGVPHHITQRGNDRQDVFRTDVDRVRYLQLLAEHAGQWGVRLLGYCLMSNHVHLIAVPRSPESFARGIGRAHYRYTREYNLMNRRSGHLWQNRFYSAPLDRAHLLRALRYVDLNPVRARLVATEVREWLEGNNDWAAFGVFEIESGDFAGRAEGNLIPQSFYTAHRLRRHNRDGGYASIPRAKAETFLANWRIGQDYDGYIYPDARDHIFFELPGAETNARMVKNLATTAGIFLALGLLASISAAHIVRRRD